MGRIIASAVIIIFSNYLWFSSFVVQNEQGWLSRWQFAECGWFNIKQPWSSVKSYFSLNLSAAYQIGLQNSNHLFISELILYCELSRFHRRQQAASCWDCVGHSFTTQQISFLFCFFKFVSKMSDKTCFHSGQWTFSPPRQKTCQVRGNGGGDCEFDGDWHSAGVRDSRGR